MSRTDKLFAKTSALLLVLCMVATVPAAAQDGEDAALPTWEDVGFWAADASANTLQNQANGTLLQRYQDIFDVLRLGYEAVRILTDDNRKLHEEFFAELARIDPVVSEYYKVFEITQDTRRLLQDLRGTMPELLGTLSELDLFSPDELDAILNVSFGIADRLDNLVTEAMAVAVPGNAETLEMMTSERIEAIDRIHAEVQAISQDLRNFQSQIRLLAVQRGGQRAHLAIEALYDPRA